MPIGGIPITAGEGTYYPITFKEGNGVRLAHYMNSFIGVVAGEKPNGKPHAVTWDMKKFYDPGSGNVFEDMDFDIRERFFALVPVGNISFWLTNVCKLKAERSEN